MPEIWLEPDELQALQDIFDWRNRFGRPLDWAAYDRARTRIVNIGTESIAATVADSVRARRSDEAQGGSNKSEVSVTINAADLLYECIARRAYELYLTRGREPGHDMEDWVQAEAEVKNSLMLS
jgi:DUF2934 family protein